MTIDDEALAGSESDLAARVARYLDRAAHCAARFFRVPQIPFEIKDACAGDQLVVERGGGEELACPEEGVHRPLAIGRDEDEAARGRGLAFAGRRVEIDPHRADVVAEDVAQLVLRHLPDECALRAQRRHAGKRVGGRAPGNFLRRPHRLVQSPGAVLVDQRHPALVEIEFGDQVFFARGHHIDDGIADGDYVVTGFGHGYSGEGISGVSGAVSGSSGFGQGQR